MSITWKYNIYKQSKQLPYFQKYFKYPRPLKTILKMTKGDLCVYRTPLCHRALSFSKTVVNVLVWIKHWYGITEEQPVDTGNGVCIAQVNYFTLGSKNEEQQTQINISLWHALVVC